jgi:hypothetical protein
MPEQRSQQITALDELTQISNVLKVPLVGTPLPTDRRWTLPRPDEQALADHPEPLNEKQDTAQRVSGPAEEDKDDKSYGKDSAKQSKGK